MKLGEVKGLKMTNSNKNLTVLKFGKDGNTLAPTVFLATNIFSIGFCSGALGAANTGNFPLRRFSP